jgi:cobaltochelatase CobS
MMPDGHQGARYYNGPFLNGYESGGLVVLEEFDTVDPSVVLVLNTAIDSDTLPVPNRGDKPLAKRHKDFYLIIDANTFGDGASREYVGRMQQDAAFLDRFTGATFFLDYCPELESQLALQYKKHGQNVLAFVRELRKKTRETQTRRIVSTRLLLRMCQWTEAGLTPDQAMSRCLVHWTDAERAKLETGQILQESFK